MNVMIDNLQVIEPRENDTSSFRAPRSTCAVRIFCRSLFTSKDAERLLLRVRDTWIDKRDGIIFKAETAARPVWTRRRIIRRRRKGRYHYHGFSVEKEDDG